MNGLSKSPLANLRKQAWRVQSRNFLIGLNKSNIHGKSVTPSSVPNAWTFRGVAPGHTSLFSCLYAIHQYCVPYILADIDIT